MNKMKIIITYENQMTRNINHKRKSYETMKNHNNIRKSFEKKLKS